MPTIPSPAPGAKIIVEAGHIYSNEAPSLEHEIGAKLGSLVCIVLNSMGHYTQNWLFMFAGKLPMTTFPKHSLDAEVLQYLQGAS